jgi:hypothetical protein
MRDTPHRRRALVVAASLGLTAAASAACSSTPAAGSHGSPLHESFSAAPDFSAFVGSWSAHDTDDLIVRSSGQGHVGIPDFLACPMCSEADAPLNTISFTLTAVSGHRATGTVTSSTDPNGQDQNGNTVNGEYAPGVRVEIQLTAGSPGQLEALTVGGTLLRRFCDPAAEAASECGA